MFCRTLCAASLALSFSTLASGPVLATGFSREAAVETVKALSADAMGGRLTGTSGNAMARTFLLGRLKAMGVKPLGEAFEHPFDFAITRDEETRAYSGINYLFRIEGRKPGNKAIVVTAHYDHVGTRQGQIYNGADDNASGVAGLFAVAESFLSTPPEHDIVFALLDSEELGLQGARALLGSDRLEGVDIALNINFDMLSQNNDDELYVAGAFHTASLKPLIDEVAARAPISLMMGHDDPALGNQDWTFQSDHGVFHRAGIPFVYFGVEDHPHYHQPSDDFDTIPLDFFIKSLETVVLAARHFDQSLESIVN